MTKDTVATKAVTNRAAAEVATGVTMVVVINRAADTVAAEVVAEGTVAVVAAEVTADTAAAVDTAAVEVEAAAVEAMAAAVVAPTVHLSSSATFHGLLQSTSSAASSVDTAKLSSLESFRTATLADPEEWASASLHKRTPVNMLSTV